jgi:hypothetical protein
MTMALSTTDPNHTSAASVLSRCITERCDFGIAHRRVCNGFRVVIDLLLQPLPDNNLKTFLTTSHPGRRVTEQRSSCNDARRLNERKKL